MNNENDGSDLDSSLCFFGPVPKQWAPFHELKSHCYSLRDAVHSLTMNAEPNMAETTISHMFNHMFNSYKSILLLLEERYCESAMVVFRNLWESSLNLHWIGADYPARLQDYMNYSSVEFRTIIKKSDDPELLSSYDSATSRFQSKFSKKKKDSQKETLSDNFTNKSIYDRARELGEPWISDYALTYKWLSMYSHGAPAVIIHSMKQAQFKCHDIEDNNNSSLIAVISARILAKDIALLEKLQIFSSTDTVSISMVGLELFIEDFENGQPNKNKATS